MKIPGHIKPLLGFSLRRATEDDEPLLESSGQKQARLSKQVLNDKQRAVINRNREIKRITGMLNRTQDHNLKKELKQKIKNLEAENKEERRFE